MDDALSAATGSAPATIRLLKNINYSGNIVIEGKTITIETNGFTLNVTNTTREMSALEVGSGGVVNLDTSDGGEFNILSDGAYASCAVYAHDGGRATVTSATVTGIESKCVVATGTDTFVRVNGDITVLNDEAYGVEAYENSAVEVGGNINVDGIFSFGVLIYRNASASVAGSVTVTGYNSRGVHTEGGLISVIGNVTATGTETKAIEVYTSDQVTVGGNVTVSGKNSYGILALGSVDMTIHGTLTAPVYYIMFGSKNIVPTNYVKGTTLYEHYKIFTEGSYTVRVKNNTPVARTTVPVQRVSVDKTATFIASNLAFDVDNDRMTITDIVANSNPDAATSSLVNGVVTLSGKEAGSTTLEVTVSDGVDNINVSVPITVSTEPLAPIIVTQPTNQAVTTGQTVTLSVETTGDAPISYRWEKDGNTLTNGGRINGATTATLTVTNVQATDAGSYSVVVTNETGSVTSDAVTLTVNPVANPACEIDSVQYATLEEALSSVAARETKTIRLLKNINCDGGIRIGGKTITFSTNGYVLNINDTTNHALEVYSGGVVNLDTSGGGAVNVVGRAYCLAAVYAHSGGRATVSSVSLNSYGSVAVAVYAYDGGFIRVNGDITASGNYC